MQQCRQERVQLQARSVDQEMVLSGFSLWLRSRWRTGTDTVTCKAE